MSKNWFSRFLRPGVNAGMADIKWRETNCEQLGENVRLWEEVMVGIQDPQCTLELWLVCVLVLVANVALKVGCCDFEVDC